MRRKHIIFLSLIMVVFILSGCSNEQTVSSASAATATESPIQISESMPEDNERDVIPVQVTVINTCGSDIGMFSIIDPATKEQINLAQIEDQSTITIGANWPVDETELFWAIYNVNGELCIEGSSDITGITESALIVLNGEGDVTDVKLTVK